MIADLAGDDPHQGAAVPGSEQGHVIGFEPLIGGGDHFVPGRQVDPQLNSVELAPGHDELLRRRLDVQNAPPRGHPLRRSVPNEATTAMGVLVLERAVDHVRDGLEPAMGVPGRALGLPRRVVDLPHLVHVHERVEILQVYAGEGAADGETLALEPTGSCGDGRDRTLGRLRAVEGGNGCKRAQITDGDSGHGNLRSWSGPTVLTPPPALSAEYGSPRCDRSGRPPESSPAARQCS